MRQDMDTTETYRPLRSQEPGLEYDVATGRFTGGHFPSPPRLVHSLISALAFQHPQTLSAAGLFNEMFPGHTFSGDASVHRIHQAVHRTRRWLEARGIPLLITERGGAYSLQVNGPISVRVPSERTILAPAARRLKVMAEHFGDREFSASDARSELAVSSAVFKTVMAWAVRNGKADRRGAGPATRYRILAR